MAVVSGKYGYMSVLFAGAIEPVSFDITDWNVTPSMEAVDTTNTNSLTDMGTWEDSVPSIYKADCSFSGPVTLDMYDGGFPSNFSGIYVRVEFGYKSGANFRVVHNDQILVASMRQTVNVKGFWQYEISGTSSSYTNL